MLPRSTLKVGNYGCTRASVIGRECASPTTENVWLHRRSWLQFKVMFVVALAARVKSRPAKRTAISTAKILGDRQGILTLAAHYGTSLPLVLAPNDWLVTSEFLVTVYARI